MFSCSINDNLEAEKECYCVLETATISVKTVNGLPTIFKTTSTRPIKDGCKEDGTVLLDTKLVVKTVRCKY